MWNGGVRGFLGSSVPDDCSCGGEELARWIDAGPSTPAADSALSLECWFDETLNAVTPVRHCDVRLRGGGARFGTICIHRTRLAGILARHQVVYVAGWIDGRSQGLWDTLQAIDEKRWSKGVLEGLEDDVQLRGLFSGAGITVNQLVDGVDKFYEDHRNMHIELRAVVDIVLDEISGKIVLDDEAMRRIRAIASEQHARP